MIRLKRLLGTACGAAFALGLAACSNDPTLSGVDQSGASIAFAQIDRGGRPFVAQLFSPFATHDAYDRGTPGTDATTLAPALGTFLTTTAGRSAAIASKTQAVLGTDVLVADLSQSGAASYLGVETGGRLSPNGTVGGGGGLFGGRGLVDDTATANLGIAFGATIPALFGVADDGAEKNGANGTPQLTTDGVASSGTQATTSFPYLAAPL